MILKQIENVCYFSGVFGIFVVLVNTRRGIHEIIRANECFHNNFSLLSLAIKIGVEHFIVKVFHPSSVLSSEKMLSHASNQNEMIFIFTKFHTSFFFNLLFEFLFVNGGGGGLNSFEKAYEISREKGLIRIFDGFFLKTEGFSPKDLRDVLGVKCPSPT